jgi:hypothetical protein
VWLLRELLAQVSRLGLALGVLSAGAILVAVCLPIYERFPPLAGPGVYSRSPVRLENSLIGYREGWILVGLLAVGLGLLFAYRRLGRLRPVAALALLGLGVMMLGASARFAEHNPVGYCTVVPADAFCAPSYPFADARALPEASGYGFTLLDLGAAGFALSGLLLVLPAAVPRRRRRRFAGREAVVWL